MYIVLVNTLFFCLHFNWPSLSSFKPKFLLNSADANVAIRANLHEDKRIMYFLPFWNKVYKFILGVEYEATLSQAGSQNLGKNHAKKEAGSILENPVTGETRTKIKQTKSVWKSYKHFQQEYVLS